MGSADGCLGVSAVVLRAERARTLVRATGLSLVRQFVIETIASISADIYQFQYQFSPAIDTEDGAITGKWQCDPAST